MAPQDVNAYYNPTMNEIVFPAAILQPPFFYVDGDDAVNYGAIGVVIGHEMTHGFDDQGCQYDKVGNLANWWTADDSKLFNERTKVLANQFNNYTVLDTLKANGELSLGENIADLGGLNVAYNAMKKAATGNEKPIDGFTPDQRFFLAYAHLWAQNIRDKEIVRRTKEDVHSLGRLRIIGPLRNMPEFHNAFDVKEGDYMYLKAADRAVIW
jgi:putative endopeptidase